MEKHERPSLEDPWSIRQTAVYHKLRLGDQTSTWLFVQLAKPVRELIEERMSTDDDVTPDAASFHAIKVHTLLLTKSQHNWKAYIKYLTECEAKLVGFIV